MPVTSKNQELQVEMKCQNVLRVIKLNPEDPHRVPEDRYAVHYVDRIDSVPIDKTSSRLYIDYISGGVLDYLFAIIDEKSKSEMVYFDITRSFGIIPSIEVNGRCYPIISINKWKETGCKIDYMTHPDTAFIRSIPINAYIQMRLDKITEADEVTKKEMVDEIEYDFLTSLQTLRNVIMERRDVRQSAFDIRTMEADEKAYLMMKASDFNVKDSLIAVIRELMVYLKLNNMSIIDIESNLTTLLSNENWMNLK